MSEQVIVESPAVQAPVSKAYYEAVIKVNVADEPARRARDIEEGIGYACALLLDEYGRTADEIGRLLETVTDDVYDEEVRRGERS